MLATTGDEIGVMVGAGTAPGDEHCVRQTQLRRSGNAGGVGDVRNRYRDFDSWEFSGLDGVCDGEKVGAAAGEENAEAEGLTRVGDGSHG